MDFSKIPEWANKNQGLLAILIFLATLIIGWVSGFFKWIYNKFFKNNQPNLLSAGRDIRAGGDITVGNKTFIQRSGKNSENTQGENITINKYDGDKQSKIGR